MNNNTLKDNLVTLRKHKGLTQKELAVKLNYSDKVISKWERGESLPDIVALNCIAEFYQVSIDELVSKSDTNNIPNTLKSNELSYEFIKKPKRIMFHTIWPIIGIYIYFGLHFIISGLYIWFAIVTIPLIIYGIILDKYTQHVEIKTSYNQYHIKVIHKATKACLYIDDVLVDEIDNTWIITFRLTGKIDNQTLKVNINSWSLRNIKIFIE